MSEPHKDPVTGRFLPAPRGKGNIKHGVPYFLRTGRLPSVRGRRALARYLREFELKLRESLGGDLTPQREAMVRQILRCENVLRLIELYLLRASPMNPYKLRKGKLELQPCLEKSYGLYLNVQRQAILALGLDRRRVEEPLDLGRYLAEHDARQAEAAAGAKDAGQDGDGQGARGKGSKAHVEGGGQTSGEDIGAEPAKEGKAEGGGDE